MNKAFLFLVIVGASFACTFFPVSVYGQATSTTRPKMVVPNAAVNMVGRWLGQHVDWMDLVTFKADGTYSRTNGDAGHWHVELENGKRILHLEWDNYGPELLPMVNADEFRATFSSTNGMLLTRLTGDAATFDPQAPAQESADKH